MGRKVSATCTSPHFRNGGMKIPSPFKRRVAVPVIGNDGSAWRNDVLDEASQRFGTSVWHHGESNTSGDRSILPLVVAAAVLALFNLDRTGDENHVVNASTLAASTAADVGFIGFDVFSGIDTNPILVGPHHAGPQFVKNLESSLVAWQSELPLELDGRHAGRLAGDQVGCPEPHRERCVRAFHDGARSEARIAVAMTAPTNAGAVGKTVRLSGRTAVVTNKAVAPSGALKVGRAGRFVPEQSLKLTKRAGKRQIVSLKHVDNHVHPKSAQMLNILPVVGLGDNRISTDQWFALFFYKRISDCFDEEVRTQAATLTKADVPQDQALLLARDPQNHHFIVPEAATWADRRAHRRRPSSARR